MELDLLVTRSFTIRKSRVKFHSSFSRGYCLHPDFLRRYICKNSQYLISASGSEIVFSLRNLFLRVSRAIRLYKDTTYTLTNEVNWEEILEKLQLLGWAWHHPLINNQIVHKFLPLDQALKLSISVLNLTSASGLWYSGLWRQVAHRLSRQNQETRSQFHRREDIKLYIID